MGIERLVGVAAVVALALAALVIGCIVDDTWLSMCTALWYLALGFVWSMTAQGGLCAAQPGFVPVDSGGSGLCGGPLCALWGAGLPPSPLAGLSMPPFPYLAFSVPARPAADSLQPSAFCLQAPSSWPSSRRRPSAAAW